MFHIFTKAYGIKEKIRKRWGKRKLEYKWFYYMQMVKKGRGGGLGLYNNLLGSKQDNSFVGKSNINFFGQEKKEAYKRLKQIL